MALQYKIFLGKNVQDISLQEDITLSELRNQLAESMTEDDLFAYYDLRQRRQYTQLKQTESNFRVSNIADTKGRISVINTKSNKPDLQVITTQSFANRYLQVSLELDNSNAKTKDINNGKMNPVLMENVQTVKDAINDFPDVLWNYAVICEMGSVIQLNYACKGATSFKVEHESQESSIKIDRDGTNGLGFLVEDYHKLGIDPNNRLAYSSLSITAFQEPGQKEDKGYPSNLFGKTETKETNALLIHGESITSAVPQPIDISPILEDKAITPENNSKLVVGEITIYFLVFKTKEDAQLMLQQNF